MNPDHLQTVAFPASRLGRRGYEEGAVREFLSTVHGEFVRLINERTSMWQEVQRLRRRIIAGELDGDDKVLFGEADAHVHAVRILSTAQVTADRYVADAQGYSSRLTEEARRRRDQIMQDAQQYADMLLEDAHAKAREAAVSALDGVNGPDGPNRPNGFGGPKGPVAPVSEEQYRAAQAELAYLRTYSDVYRAHLRAYTEGILRGIEEWEHKESAALKEVTQGGAAAGAKAIDSKVYMHH